jgi:hypothetical protein
VSTCFTIEAVEELSQGPMLKKIPGNQTMPGISGGAGRSRTDLHGFAIRCITALLPRQGFCELSDKKGKLGFPFSGRCWHFFLNIGAGNEARTRDLNLGKVALYQLSYSRVTANYTSKHRLLQ